MVASEPWRRRAASLVAPDLDGRLRTRHLPAGVDESSRTPCFADIVFALDDDDVLIPRPEGFTGWWPSWDDGFGDLLTAPDLDSRRPIGWRSDQDVVFADLTHRDGTSCQVAPRQVLRGVCQALAVTGSRARVGIEVEFFLAEREHGAAAALIPSDVYAFAPHALDRAVLETVVTALLASDIAVESWYAEGGPRQYEIALAPTDPLTAADVTLLTRHAVTEVAAAHGLRAVFAPKPGPGFGSGLHVHVSVAGNDGTNVLRGLGTPGEDPLGPALLAGVVDVLHPATALLSPTPRGYERLAPHTAAGTSSTWALDNRTVGVRYLDRQEDARIEVRAAASDAQPHLVVAALLAGAVSGMVGAMVPPPASIGDAYATGSPETALPANLPSAVRALRESEVLRQYLGDDLVDHYAVTRDWAAGHLSRVNAKV